jgi:hypothetical protein
MAAVVHAGVDHGALGEMRLVLLALLDGAVVAVEVGILRRSAATRWASRSP